MASRRASKEAEASAAVHTFGNLADALTAKKEREQKSDVTMKKVRWLLDLVRPTLGARPMGKITSRETLEAIRPLERRGKL